VEHSPNDPHGGHTREKQHHYRQLAIMIAISFAAMYVLMYAMVDSFDSFVHNVNQAYMAGLMAAPMGVIELLVMRGMYRNRRANMMFGGGALLAGVLFFLAIRYQSGVGDRQFARSMIPHHAGAILMCEQTSLENQELRRLCFGRTASSRANEAR
jgi:uncharacterized protein (DUF305 family)